MADVGEFTKNFVSAILGLAIGITMVPIVNNIISGANITDPVQASLVGLLSYMVIFGVVLFGVRTFIA